MNTAMIFLTHNQAFLSHNWYFIQSLSQFRLQWFQSCALLKLKNRPIFTNIKELGLQDKIEKFKMDRVEHLTHWDWLRRTFQKDLFQLLDNLVFFCCDHFWCIHIASYLLMQLLLNIHLNSASISIKLFSDVMSM